MSFDIILNIAYVQIIVQCGVFCFFLEYSRF